MSNQPNWRPNCSMGSFSLQLALVRGSTQRFNCYFCVMFILLYVYIKWSIFCPHRLFLHIVGVQIAAHDCRLVAVYSLLANHAAFLKVGMSYASYMSYTSFTSGKLIMHTESNFQHFSCTINCTVYIPQKCVFLRVTQLMSVHVRNF